MIHKRKEGQCSLDEIVDTECGERVPRKDSTFSHYDGCDLTCPKCINRAVLDCEIEIRTHELYKSIYLGLLDPA